MRKRRPRCGDHGQGKARRKLGIPTWTGAGRWPLSITSISISGIWNGAPRSGRPTPMRPFQYGCGSMVMSGPSDSWTKPGSAMKPWTTGFLAAVTQPNCSRFAIALVHRQCEAFSHVGPGVYPRFSTRLSGRPDMDMRWRSGSLRFPIGGYSSVRRRAGCGLKEPSGIIWMWADRIRSLLFFIAGLIVELPEGFVPESSAGESIPYDAVITSLHGSSSTSKRDGRCAPRQSSVIRVTSASDAASACRTGTPYGPLANAPTGVYVTPKLQTRSPLLTWPPFCQVTRPSINKEGLYAPALRFGEQRVMAILSALVGFCYLIGGFNNRQLVQRVGALLQSPYTCRQATYESAAPETQRA